MKTLNVITLEGQIFRGIGYIPGVHSPYILFQQHKTWEGRIHPQNYCQLFSCLMPINVRGGRPN